MSKKVSLPLGKAIRGSITYHVNEDGHISQVINHILPTGIKKQVPIYATLHSKVLVTQNGLQAVFSFPRQTMSMGEIIEQMYNESDEVMGWLQSEGGSAITQAELKLAEQPQRA